MLSTIVPKEKVLGALPEFELERWSEVLDFIGYLLLDLRSESPGSWRAQSRPLPTSSSKPIIWKDAIVTMAMIVKQPLDPKNLPHGLGQLLLLTLAIPGYQAQTVSHYL